MNLTCSLLSKDGKCLTDKQEVFARWTEYCSEFYSQRLDINPNVLIHIWTMSDEEELPRLWDEVRHAVSSFKTGKTACIDNISAEFIIHGGDAAIDVLTRIGNDIRQSNQWPALWTWPLIITLPKQGYLWQCNNHRTICLISHVSKVMLKILLNWQAISEKSHCSRLSWFSTKQKYKWTNFQPACTQWEIKPTPTEDIPCLYRFQKGIPLSMAWRSVGYNIPVWIWWQVNHIDMPATQTSKQCSNVPRCSAWLVSSNSWSLSRLPTVTHNIQYLPRMDNGRSSR